MSVTGPSYNINAIKKLSELELQLGLEGDSSWHTSYKNSCYVFIGGLPFGLTEGDIAIVFSQWGEIVDVHLVRDKKTGASKGYAFLGYEDQRSTILAVDNFNGYELLGRRLRVDHCQNFRAPRAKSGDTLVEEYKPTGAEGRGFDVYEQTIAAERQISNSTTKSRFDTPGTRDADDLWAEEFEKSIRKRRKKGEKNF